jgi:hypothetical protein
MYVSTTIVKSFQSKHDKAHTRHIFPRWLTVLYGGACIFLIPWTILLAYILPQHYVSNHWNIAWAGFDVFEIIFFGLTAILAVKKTSWAALSASVLGTLLITDAWFSILTARTGRSEHKAIIQAIAIELPLSLLSYALALRVFKDIKSLAPPTKL